MSDPVPINNLTINKASQLGPNAEKNRKKRNKKKAKKKALSTSAISSEPTLTNDLLSSTMEAPIINQNASAPAIAENKDNMATNGNITTQFNDKIHTEGKANSDIQIITNTNTATAVDTLPGNKSTKMLSKPFALSNNVQECIKSTVASRAINIDNIIEKIKKNVQAGSYKGKNQQAVKPTTDTKNMKHDSNQMQESYPLTDNVKHCIAYVVASRSIDVDSIIHNISSNRQTDNHPEAQQTNNDDSVKTRKKESAGIGTILYDTLTATAATNTNKNDGLANDATLSSNVQHCIQSVINSRSIDVYRIISSAQSSKTSGRNIAAVPQTLPSSSVKPTKLARKDESNERRKLDFFKKKDCIIL
ncbi:MAG: hypothetical protein EXX96DRAFT_613863 [Benjaminiella poitrasii]|nr:MAG: hypothetical protein EXX96DRAFT_613863 [Benjaminiella poitrasii]